MVMIAPSASAKALPPKSAAAATDDLPSDLTSDEARRRLAKFGANAMPDTSAHPLRMALEKFWAPVPWMLEAAIVLQLALGKYLESGIIPLVLTAILASIPVALPATFTLASALGARALAKLGVLPTRLSAVDEAAAMNVLCAPTRPAR